MRKSILLLASVSLLALSLGAVAAGRCRYSKPVSARINASGLRSLQLKLGSADLQIQGDAGANQVQVSGTACASNPAALKDMRVEANRNGNAGVITARNRNFNLFGYAYMKLQAHVPAALAVQIEDGSGDVGAERLASLDFHSGSGDLHAGDITGKLSLRLGSGDVHAHRVGSVELGSTGSGDVTVRGVSGNVLARQSGSGDLTFSDVKGDVRVGSSGSGDIEFNNIDGSVNVGSTGSGDVRANGVGGNFTVGATGSGEISHQGVKGRISVPRDDD
jgi:hypothetical protein